LEAVRTKAQHQKEKEEAKAKVDAEEARKRKEAEDLFREAAKQVAERACKVPEENWKQILVVSLVFLWGVVKG